MTDKTKIQLNRRCKLCGSEKIVNQYKIDEYNYLRCRNCGIIFLKQDYTNQDLDGLYNQEKYLSKSYKYGKENKQEGNYFFNESYIVAKSQLALGDIEKVLIANNLNTENKILDIGCAAGFFLNVAKKKKYDTYGIELSDEGSSYAKEKFNISIIAKDVLELDDSYDAFFDIITLFDVLEHLVDPVEYLKKINKILKPGGVLVIEVPNIKTIDRFSNKILLSILQPPHHLFVFNPQILKKLLRDNDFFVLDEKKYISDLIGKMFFKIYSVIRLKKSVNRSIHKDEKCAEVSDFNLVTKPRPSYIVLVRDFVKNIFPGSKMRIIFKKIS